MREVVGWSTLAWGREGRHKISRIVWCEGGNEVKKYFSLTCTYRLSWQNPVQARIWCRGLRWCTYFTHPHACYTHSPHYQTQTTPTRTPPLKRNKKNINHVHITYITNSLHTSQNSLSLVYINMPMPHARPPEANHANPRLFKANRNEGKAPYKPKPTPGHPFSCTNKTTQKIQPGTS